MCIRDRVSTVVAGIIWGKIIGNKIYTKLPANVEEIADIDKNLPSLHGLWQFVIVNIELSISLFETLIVEDSVFLLSLGIVVRLSLIHI